MDFKNSFSISAMGMSLERARVDVAALNLANANTVISSDGSGFRPMRVVAKSMTPAFLFSELMNNGGIESLQSSRNFQIEAVDSAPRQVHEPSHPMANGLGFVSYPAVDVANETVTMMSAMRAYEANVAAMNMSRNMALKSLEIGGGN